MLDIVSMLFTLLRAYVPAEIRWSYIMDLYDMFSWNICMCTILYCVFFSLAYAPPYPILLHDAPLNRGFLLNINAFMHCASGSISHPLTIPVNHV